MILVPFFWKSTHLNMMKWRWRQWRAKKQATQSPLCCARVHWRIAAPNFADNEGQHDQRRASPLSICPWVCLICVTRSGQRSRGAQAASRCARVSSGSQRLFHKRGLLATTGYKSSTHAKWWTTCHFSEFVLVLAAVAKLQRHSYGVPFETENTPS